MPRKSVSAFSQLQQQAKKLLEGLAAEIQSKKSELTRLEQEFEQVTGIAGLRGASLTSKRARTKATARQGGAGTSGSRRINWTEVLAKLPQEFKASDIRSIRGLKSKHASELFAAITRWIDSGTVKKKARGAYLRVK